MYRVGVFHHEAVLLEVLPPHKTGYSHYQLQSTYYGTIILPVRELCHLQSYNTDNLTVQQMTGLLC